MKKFADETRRSMIKVKGGYSDITGLSPFRTQLQLEEFDERARMILSNTTFDMLEFYLEKSGFSYRHARYSLGDHEFYPMCLRKRLGCPLIVNMIGAEYLSTIFTQ